MIVLRKEQKDEAVARASPSIEEVIVQESGLDSQAAKWENKVH